MKKIFSMFLSALSLFLISSLSTNASACSIANISGSAGISSPSNGPPPGYITSIVANGTSTLSVTYTPTGGGSPTVSNVALGTGYCSITGSWSGTKITSVSSTTVSGTILVLKINGSNALTFGSNCGPIGSATSWTGALGGVSRIRTNAPKSLYFEGVDYSSGSGQVKDGTFSLVGTCSAYLDYTINSVNAFVLNATATDATSVEFVWDTVNLGSDSSPPFSTSITGANKRHHAYVVAHFNGGDITTSLYPIDPIQISSGTQTHCMQYLQDIYCWGRGQYGAIGNGSTANQSSPVLLTSIFNIRKVAMHQYGGCAINDGGVKCWGRNTNGIIGQDPATVTSTSIPFTIFSSGAGGDNIQDLAAGDKFACVVGPSGEVKCWGDGSSGQMGNGTTTANNFTPVTVIASGAKNIFAGGSTVCALMTDNTVKCWGLDDRGQVGNGGSASSAVTTPATVSGLSNVIDVAVGYRHACAVISGGSMKCWGDNTFATLGTGSADSGTHVSPVTASAYSSYTVKSVVSGRNYATCAINSVSGSQAEIRCVGENAFGQAGTNTTSAYEATPNSVTNLSHVASVAVGAFNTCAVDSGQVYCWGDNSYDQLGNSSANDPELIPVNVTGF